MRKLLKKIQLSTILKIGSPLLIILIVLVVVIARWPQSPLARTSGLQITPIPAPTPTAMSTFAPFPTPTSSPSPTPTFTAKLPVGQTGNWQTIFDDEFSGNQLDSSKWTPNWLGTNASSITEPVNDGETECVDPSQVSVSGGSLLLTAVARSCLDKSYASGLIQSNGRFSFTYGYMEARIWAPAGKGVWPAFWSDGQIWPQDGEIDVLEAHGNDQSEYHIHYAGCGGDCAVGGGANLSGATSGWHTYAVDWEPGVITWFYDGQQVFQFRNSVVPSGEMYLIVNLGLSSNASAVPATMRVDYVRVWQKG